MTSSNPYETLTGERLELSKNRKELEERLALLNERIAFKELKLQEVALLEREKALDLKLQEFLSQKEQESVQPCSFLMKGYLASLHEEGSLAQITMRSSSCQQSNPRWRELFSTPDRAWCIEEEDFILTQLSREYTIYYIREKCGRNLTELREHIFTLIKELPEDLIYNNHGIASFFGVSVAEVDAIRS